ncbi:MAG: thioredoxin-disulfide reductase [Caldimicrobium sp.]
MLDNTIYDLVILGGGPAGLTAGLYAKRSYLQTLLIEKGPVGGQVLYTDLIENYPGFPEGISGYDLIERFKKQVEKFGLPIHYDEVVDFANFGDFKEIILASGKKISTKALILALGAKPKVLNIPGEKEFTGKGVSYCAICDGPFYRDEEVAVVGGGNTALQEALFLTKFARKVFLIHRRESFRGTAILQERVLSNPKIEVLWPFMVEKIEGKDKVEKIIIRNLKEGQIQELRVSGIFIFIGLSPQTDWLKGKIDLDENGFIIVDKEMRTNVPGVFACGDVVSKKFRQIINACGEGAVAALSAEEYIKGF